MKNNFLKTLPKRKYFVHSFDSKREKETQSSSQSTDLVCFISVLQIILSWKADVGKSQSTTDCVRSEICFKEMVSNTRLDLNHLSFKHLVCEFLIICRFLFIYLLLLLITFICVIACIQICMLFFLVNHKSKLLKYIQHRQLSQSPKQMVGATIDMLNLEALVLILHPFLKTKGLQQTIGENSFSMKRKQNDV